MTYYALMLGVGWALFEIQVTTKDNQSLWFILGALLLAITKNILAMALMAWSVIHLLQYLK